MLALHRRQVFGLPAALRVNHRLIGQRHRTSLIMSFGLRLLVGSDPGWHIGHQLHFLHQVEQRGVGHGSQLALAMRHPAVYFRQLTVEGFIAQAHEVRLLGDPRHAAFKARRIAHPAAHALNHPLGADTNHRLRDAKRLHQRRCQRQPHGGA